MKCEAEIDPRDVFFSEAQKRENHAMCACVSRLVVGSAVIDVGYRGGGTAVPIRFDCGERA